MLYIMMSIIVHGENHVLIPFYIWCFETLNWIH